MSIWQQLNSSFTIWFLVNIVVWWNLNMCYVFSQEPVANLPQGRIVGIKVYMENSLNPVEIFLGVPYATPPIGRYRFSAPERHPGWRRTFYAHRMPPRCPQTSNDNNSENYSEDCLYLNIWTSRRADGKTMPVVVILYSESWDRGGVSLPCQELAAEGLVVVTVAYRLHLLGFFTLRSMSARGNLPLLDQYLALLWVRDNIPAFGGDPSVITLIGHSTGADSVIHHILSPRNTGLFQRAILMSPQDIWKAVDERKFVNSTEVESISRQIATTLGCISKVDQEIIQCMRDIPITDIVSLYSNSSWSKLFQPIPDDFLPQSEQYFPISLAAALSATTQPALQLDLLFGTTDLEDINFNNDFYSELLKQTSSYITEYVNTKKIPELLRMFSVQDNDAISMLSQIVRWEFWGAKLRKDFNKGPLEVVEGLARMESSAKWGVGSALFAARLARRISHLYVYRYLQPGTVNLHGGQVNFTGAVHGSDLIALLGDALMLQIARRPTTQEQKRISFKFRQYIVNFIKHGSPETEDIWQRYKIGDAYIHAIYDENKAIQNLQRLTKDAAFWLQYMPQLNSFFTANNGRTEQLAFEKDDTRLKGGVFAMSGLSAVLMLIICVCAILLYRARTYRSSISDEIQR